jgi:hypothetical protein
MDDVRLSVQERAGVEMQERLARYEATGEYVAHRNVLSARRPKPYVLRRDRTRARERAAMATG